MVASKRQTVTDTTPATGSNAGEGRDASGTEKSAHRLQRRDEPGLLIRAWRAWLRFAELIGTINMIIILSVIYWTFGTVIAIPFKLRADPLSTRYAHYPGWVRKPDAPMDLESMRNQY